MVELPADEHYLRIAFREAERARERGNLAFGALLVNADGEPVLAAQNSVVTDSDVTAHAEMNLANLHPGSRPGPANASGAPDQQRQRLP